MPKLDVIYFCDTEMAEIDYTQNLVKNSLSDFT